MRLRELVINAAWVLTLTVVPTVCFSAMTIVPDLRVGVVYATNGGPTGLDVDSVGGEIFARINFSFVNDRGSFVIAPRVRATRHEDEQTTEQEEKTLQADWTRLFRTGRFDIRFGISQQDSFTSELRDFDVDLDSDIEIGNEDSGIVDQDTTRDRVFFRGEALKAVTQRGNAVFTWNFRDLSYDDVEASDRVDFSNTKLGAGWRWNRDQRSSIVFTGNFQHYDANNGQKVDTVGGEVEYNMDFTETSRFYLAAGYDNSSSELNGVDLGSSGNVTFRAGGEKSWQLTRHRIGLYRTLQPTSAGDVREQTGLSYIIERRMSPRFTLRAGLQAFQSDNLSNQRDSRKRDAVSGRLGLSWRMRRNWFLELNYRHSRQEFDDVTILGGETELRNTINLSIRYRGKDPARLQ